MKKAIFLFGIFSVFLLGFLIITNPSVCTDGAITGILLCGKIIIPSLFPFTVCILFILKSGILNRLGFLNKFTLKIFGLSSQMFLIFLLSLIGGYPLGAKILNETEADTPTKSRMLNFCVNAGPAFIILVVGLGRFGSKKIGYILFFSHILSSVLMSFIFKKRSQKKAQVKLAKLNSIDNFVLSTSESASVTLNICSFVILFSVIINYLNFYSAKLPFLKLLTLILEVTNAITASRNIILVSFLLGLGGICIWCQVLSLSTKIKINYPLFVLSRIIHGGLSAIFTYAFLKIFKIPVPTLSNGQYFTFSLFEKNLAVSVSLITMGIVLIISLYTKKYTGNLLKDLV